MEAEGSAAHDQPDVARRPTEEHGRLARGVSASDDDPIIIEAKNNALFAAVVILSMALTPGRRNVGAPEAAPCPQTADKVTCLRLRRNGGARTTSEAAHRSPPATDG